MPKSLTRTASKAIFLTSAATLALVAAPAFAQNTQAQDEGNEAQDSGGLTEIVVTAQKREEGLQDTPIAITAVCAGYLQPSANNAQSGV